MSTPPAKPSSQTFAPSSAPSSSAGLPPAPTHLVDRGRQQLGRFAGAFAHTNLIDAPLSPPFERVPRWARRWRLKEWQAVQIAGPGVFVNLALFDAKLMALAQAKVYDRERGEKVVHEWKLRPGAFQVARGLGDSLTRYRDRRGSLAFFNWLDGGRMEVIVDMKATARLPRVAGRVELAIERGAPQSVSLPFAGDVGMYSFKGMFPVTGQLTVGDQLHRFTPDDTVALVDDHKGYYPYVMRWDWVTSAVCRDGHREGFNLTRNQCRDPDRYNENCAWYDDRIGVLPAVEVTRTAVGTPDELWTVRDRDGRVDLRFTPTVPGDVRVNAIVVESRYRGPFGRCDGRLEPDGLPPITVDGWFGMGEEFHLRC